MDTDIKAILVKFCEEDKFKRYVRDALNDKLFWRDILQTYQISSQVTTQVSELVPSIVKSETKDLKHNINKSVKEKIETLPAVILKELHTQIPTYLTNNAQMQQILSGHSQQLNTVLYDTAQQTLNRLTNEEQYHMVTNSHIANMTQRFIDMTDTNLQECNTKFDQHLSSYTTKVNSTLNKVTDDAKQVV